MVNEILKAAADGQRELEPPLPCRSRNIRELQVPARVMGLATGPSRRGTPTVIRRRCERIVGGMTVGTFVIANPMRTEVDPGRVTVEAIVGRVPKRADDLSRPRLLPEVAEVINTMDRHQMDDVRRPALVTRRRQSLRGRQRRGSPPPSGRSGWRCR